MTSTDYSLAHEMAFETGELLLHHFGKVTTRFKGDKNIVTEADTAAEELIVERLARLRPQDSVLAEEGTATDRGGNRRWIVDPLDGTNNFAHGFWAYAVSIALEVDGRLQLGVVHAPALGQTFAAQAGQGATLNGEPIHVSAIGEIGKSICATGFPYARRTLARNNLAEFARVAIEVQGIRRVGSAALDLCWTAAGRWDGYWEMHLSPWDVAAGIVICREAGAVVTNFAGGEIDLNRPEIVATNGLIHEALRTLLNPPSD